jgi:hypothetical protein
MGFLDEATSALDIQLEARLYELLRTLPGLTVVSDGHRPLRRARARPVVALLGRLFRPVHGVANMSCAFIVDEYVQRPEHFARCSEQTANLIRLRQPFGFALRSHWLRLDC